MNSYLHFVVNTSAHSCLPAPYLYLSTDALLDQLTLLWPSHDHTTPLLKRSTEDKAQTVVLHARPPSPGWPPGSPMHLPWCCLRSGQAPRLPDVVPGPRAHFPASTHPLPFLSPSSPTYSACLPKPNQLFLPLQFSAVDYSVLPSYMVYINVSVWSL